MADKPSKFESTGDRFDREFDEQFADSDNQEEEISEDLFILDDEIYSSNGKEEPASGDSAPAAPPKPSPPPQPKTPKSPEHSPGKPETGEDESSGEITGFDILNEEDSLLDSPDSQEEDAGDSSLTEQDIEVSDSDGFDVEHLDEEPPPSTGGEPEASSDDEETSIPSSGESEMEEELEEEFLELDFPSESENGEGSGSYEDLEELFEEESKEVDLNKKEDFEIMSNSQELRSKAVREQITRAREKSHEGSAPESGPPPPAPSDEETQVPSISLDEAGTTPPPPEMDESPEPSTPSKEKVPPLESTSKERASADITSSVDTRYTPPPSSPTPEVRPEKSRETTGIFSGPRRLLLAVLLVFMAGGGVYYFLIRDSSPGTVSRTVRKKAPPPETTTRAKRNEDTRSQKKNQAASNSLNTAESPSSGSTDSDSSKAAPGESSPQPNPEKDSASGDRKQSSDKATGTGEAVIPPSLLESPEKEQDSDTTATSSRKDRRAKILEKLDQRKSPEEELFERAREENSIELYREYVRTYPNGPHYGEAITTLNRLNRSGNQDLKQEKIRRKVQQNRSRNPRSTPRDFSSTPLPGNPAPSAPGFIETRTIRNKKILIDTATGLVWHLWSNPMNFYRTDMFKSRKHAGYTDWQLPTIKEIMTFPSGQVDFFQPARTSGISVWTSDTLTTRPMVVSLADGSVNREDPNRSHFLLVCKRIR